MPNSDYKDIKIIVDHRKNGERICWKNYYINRQRGGFLQATRGILPPSAMNVRTSAVAVRPSAMNVRPSGDGGRM